MTDRLRPRVVSSSPAPSRCPNDLDLALFAEGRLDAAARQDLVAHLADCDDCREILATVAAAMPDAVQDVAPQPAPPLPSPTRWRARAVAAALALAAMAVIGVRLAMPPAASPDGRASNAAWSDIAEAIGPTRTVEARLSGLSAHRPLASPTRAPSADASFALQALAARLSEAVNPPGADVAAQRDRRHVAGVAALVAGRPGEAVLLLEDALADAPEARVRAAILADLSAAHAELGELAARNHWSTSLRAADDALALDAASATARFNRALALEHLGRAAEAVAAWQVVAGDTSQSEAWREEAASHLKLLAVP